MCSHSNHVGHSVSLYLFLSPHNYSLHAFTVKFTMWLSVNFTFFEMDLVYYGGAFCTSDFIYITTANNTDFLNFNHVQKNMVCREDIAPPIINDQIHANQTSFKVCHDNIFPFLITGSKFLSSQAASTGQ